MSVLFSLIKTKVFLSKEGLAYDYFHYINKNLSNYALKHASAGISALHKPKYREQLLVRAQRKQKMPKVYEDFYLVNHCHVHILHL